MKKVLLALVAVLSFSLFVVTPAFADTKIGVLNMQELLQKLPQMKQIGEDLQKQFGDRQKKLTDAQETFKKDADKFRRDLSVMSDKDKQATEDKLFKQQQDLQKMQADLQNDYMAAQNKQVDALMAKVRGVVDGIAKAGNFDYILINAGVAYAKAGSDVTPQTLQKMGAK